MPDTTGLIDTLSGVYASAVYLGSAAGTTTAAVAEGAESIGARAAEMLDALVSTVESVAEVTLDVERDLSLERAYDMDVGAMDGCRNAGTVAGDTGVVGAVGFEAAFDLENELNLTEYIFSEAEHQIFAVIRGCSQHGAVTGKRNRIGGIVGDLSCGAVVDGTAADSVRSEIGDRVGGIAGNAAGALRSDAVRATVSGGKYVGGVAGFAADAVDCAALAYIEEGSECTGCLAGWSEGTFSGNLFVDTGAGGVDGVNYAERAEAVTYAALRANTDLPEELTICAVRSLDGDRIIAEETVPFGGAVDALPEMPRTEAGDWQWDDADLERIYDDITVTGGYIPPRTTLSDGGEPPLLLAEGTFYVDETLTAAPVEYARYAADGEITGAWTVSVSGGEDTLRLRMRAAADETPYLAENGATVLLVKREAKAVYRLWMLAAGAVLAVVLAIVTALLVRQKRKKKARSRK